MFVCCCRNLHQAFVPGKLMQALVADVGEDIEAAPLNEGPELASDVEFGLAEKAEEGGQVEDKTQGAGSD